MIYAVILFAVLASLVGIGYYLNAKTPKPEGCQDMQNCEGCQMTNCVNHPSGKEKQV